MLTGEYVVFTTDGEYSAFVAQLTEPMTVIVDTTADTSNYDTMPICTGPYAVSEYVSEEKIELVANENYWDGAPEIKEHHCKEYRKRYKGRCNAFRRYRPCTGTGCYFPQPC